MLDFSLPVPETEPVSFETTHRPRRRLLLFARVPRRGEVKSRVAKGAGEDRALELYRAMLADLLDELRSLPAGIGVEVVWTADGEVTGDDLRAAFRDFETSRQCGHDLGERILVSFSERFFFHEVRSIIAIGVDDPGIRAGDIVRAFDLLESCEWVIGPAEDGGYWLIGSRAGAFRTAAFRGIEWGSSSVLEATLHILRRSQATIALLQPRRDIDQLDDLRVLHENGALPERTMSVARSLLAESGRTE